MTQEGQCQKRGWPLNARLHRSILMPHKDVEAFRQCKAGSPSGGLGDRTESFFIGAFLVGSPRTVLCHCRRVAPHASLGVDVSNVGQAVEKLGLGGARVAWVADWQPVVNMWTATIPSSYGAFAQRRDRQQYYYC